MKLKKTMNLMILIIFIKTLIFFSSHTKAQQKYTGNEVLNCNLTSGVATSFLYTCNGKQTSCNAFLIFTARFPYNTVPAIATLMSSNIDEITLLNNVTRFTIFRAEQEVIVPVNCSCSGSGNYYQALTTYQIPTTYQETYFTIANHTYQGLSACDSLIRANPRPNLQPGDKVRVPLRCACPTKEQTEKGTKFLMSYSIARGDTIHALSKRFNVSATRIIEANSFDDEHFTIYPFTTILIPLPKKPSSLNTVNRSYNVTLSIPTLPVSRKNRSKSNKVLSVFGIAAGALSLLILLILIFIFFFHKKRTQNPQNRGRETKVLSPEDLVVEIARFHRVLKAFKFDEIKKATGNFGSRRRIEGCLYRGNFGREVLAVKRISGDVHNEVNMLYQINHLNIVKVHGFCQNNENTYLVYEYMKNGSLEKLLGKRKSKMIKSWNQRIRIALDVANGLLYLHNFTKPAYVHNYIRSSNILLDGNLRAKIANFSRATTGDSPKEDVFAFGGVLLELITGRREILQENGGKKVITRVITDVMQSPNAEMELSRFVEPCLVENGRMEYAIQVAKLGLSCLAQDPGDRPGMVEVVSILQKLQINLQESGVGK